jgi:hypothetical protein
VPTLLVEWISQHVDARWKFLLALNVFLIVIGMMMDIFSAIVIVVPLITPLAKQYGIDPFHLGVVFLLNLEIGYLTPPVGLNLFITSFKFQKPVVTVIRATVPFLLAMLVALGLVTYIPALTVVPDPTPTGRLGDLVVMVHEASEGLATVQQLTLPDGTVKHLVECEGDASPMQCEELFAAATECRKRAGGPDPECEAAAIDAYVDATSDSWDDDDDDTGDDDTGDDDTGDDDTGDDDTGDDDTGDGPPASTEAPSTEAR